MGLYGNDNRLFLGEWQEDGLPNICAKNQPEKWQWFKQRVPKNGLVRGNMKNTCWHVFELMSQERHQSSHFKRFGALTKRPMDGFPCKGTLMLSRFS